SWVERQFDCSCIPKEEEGIGNSSRGMVKGRQWGDGQYGSRNGSWGWQGRQGSKWKGGQYHKGGGGRKGKGKGGHRWHDVESMRDLPIQRFVQDDMVEDPWTSLYPRLKEEHPDLYDEYAKYLDDQRSSPQRPELPCDAPN
ncbi:hypothetical protein FOZ63_007363, partial [Perkinsus olseni]